VSERSESNRAPPLHSAQRLPERPRRALIADADQVTRLLLSPLLRSEGFDVGECGDGREALEHLSDSHFDLVVLDAALRGLDGIALCRAIRQESANPHAAIFIVATSAAESDKVLALVNGADDYVTKPLSIREFLARVSAVMRRTVRATESNVKPPIHRGDIQLDPSKRQVRVRGRVVACSKQEFDLLYALASSPGVVFTREELLARHWPTFARGTVGKSAFAKARTGRSDSSIRLVDPIISRLRRKIEHDPDAPRLIMTVWGVGYKFAESEI
jgi:two-component system OmpR family response regulator/two-component system alkaline phosphatase synthesis response regulator PhoP